MLEISEITEVVVGVGIRPGCLVNQPLLLLYICINTVPETGHFTRTEKTPVFDMTPLHNYYDKLRTIMFAESIVSIVIASMTSNNIELKSLLSLFLFTELSPSK